MFLNLIFLHDAGISVICEHLRQKFAYLCLHGFSGPYGPKWQFWRQNREGVIDAMLIPNEVVFTFGGCYLCVTFCENRSRNVTVREHTDRQTRCDRDKLNV